MKFKTGVIVALSVFCLFCVALVIDAVFHHPQQTKELLGRIVPLAGETEPSSDAELQQQATEAEAKAPVEAIVYPKLTATNAKLQTKILGAVYDEVKRNDDPDKYKFQVEFTSKGAAVKQVVLSEFEARAETDSPEAISADASSEATVIAPLTFLSPLTNGKEVYSLANTSLRVAPAAAEKFSKKAFPLDQLNWKLIETDTENQIRFEAVLKDVDTKAETLKVIKTYHIQPASYNLDCQLAVENLSGDPLKVRMQIQGPGGITREGVRQDARKVKLAYRSGETDVEVKALDAVSMKKKLKKDDTEAFLLKSKKNTQQLWSALTNMYFAAVVLPVETEEQGQPWLRFSQAQYYPAADEEDKDSQNCSYEMISHDIMLDKTGTKDALKSYSLAVYLGPKDKRIFEKNETYKALQYFQTIDFRGCCCPTSIIAPLAFGIMWLMNTLYTLMGPLGNYGVVIITLVFFVRLAMHPITKKSQVSMMKMQKLGPKMKEIQAKYANNKQEMNKQVMAMYREQGVSPVSGMLPMMLQMPIWIALWTAVYTSVDLRGAGFLPVWITDLSMPDQLFAIPYAAKLQAIPYLGKIVPNYFNLLPILMGVVMFIQQKMMPSAQATAQADSQMAQQQKMMMIMMPLMFPIMLYTGPSGVNLYIMTSIGAGVVEQKIIRKHLKEKEEAESAGKVPVTAKTGGKVKKKKPKPFYKG